MTDWINRDEDLKKHCEEGKASLRTQKMFGIVKNSYHKTERSELADTFLGHQTIKMLEENQSEAELQKAKAIEQISRLQTRII